MPRSRRLPAEAKKNLAAYATAQPKFLGNLHERMKLVVHELAKLHSVVGEGPLWQAVFDLQTEVQFYTPVNPPFGQQNWNLSEVSSQFNEGEC